MPGIGNFRGLPEDCIIHIFHHTNVRELLRCQRLSKHYNALIRQNFEHIEPRLIDDTEVRVTLPQTFAGTFVFSPAQKREKHSMHYFVNARVSFARDVFGGVKHSFIKDCFLKSNGNWHSLYCTDQDKDDIDEEDYAVLPRVLEHLASAFNFVGIQVWTMGENCYSMHNMWMVAFPRIQSITLNYTSRKIAVDLEPIFHEPREPNVLNHLKYFAIRNGFLENLKDVIESPLAVQLRVLDLRVIAESILDFNDEALERMAQLHKLKIRKNEFDVIETGVTLSGLVRLQELWKHGERQIHSMEFCIRGNFYLDGWAVVHAKHECRQCPRGRSFNHPKRARTMSDSIEHKLLRGDETLNLIIRPYDSTHYTVKFRLQNHYYAQECCQSA